jgi:hypothetical protein
VGQFAENRKAKAPMKKNMAHDAVPFTRAKFERLLQDAGFPLKEGMVSGLVFKVDLWALEPIPAAPEASGRPARGMAGERRNAQRRKE